MRRLVALLVLVGTALAALVLPSVDAIAQTAPPTISISPTSDSSGTSGTWSITVNGVGWRPARSVSIQFAQDPMTTFTPANGNWSRVINPPRRISGRYTITVVQNCSDFDTCPVTATAQFTSVPLLSLTPVCSNAGTSQTVTVNGSGWQSLPVTVTYDYPSNTVKGVTPSGGSFSVPFTVTPPNRDVVVFADQPRLGFQVRVVWPPCPPPGSTTTAPTTTTSTTNPPDDTVPDTVPDPVTTTTRPTVPGSTTTTPVTVPPTVDIPPPTPGASLALSPRLGPTGFVTGATGTGFPPGPVTLAWSPGIGSTTTIAGPDGTFSTRVLVFHGDRLGPRALIATGVGGVTAYDAFLVVPSSVQPSGQNVAQITRIRRFNQR